ncbi:MAG: type II toxin-antitoxin system VapC family toxin [Acidobacteriota bacterium]
MSKDKMQTNLAAFWDTSAIVALCAYQPTTLAAHHFARMYPKMRAWWGATVEARSAFARLWQEKELTDRELHYALNQLKTLRQSWAEIAPGERLREIAETLPDKYGLRAMDAFQLAAALVWCKEKPRKRPFICFDIRLAEAAEKAGFTVYPEP